MSRLFSNPFYLLGFYPLMFVIIISDDIGSKPAKEMTIGHGWTIPSLGEAPTAAVYVTIENGAEPNRLMAAKTPVAARVELHTHRLEDGIMMMQKLDAIDIPADGVVAMQPGGVHIMLFDLKSRFEEGETFPLTLMFEKGGNRETMIDVRWPGDQKSHDHHSHDHHSHDHH